MISWLIVALSRSEPYSSNRFVMLYEFAKAAPFVLTLMIPAGLPVPNRIEFGPRCRSTRPTLKLSHGMSVRK
jgi:hypothetical protein